MVEWEVAYTAGLFDGEGCVRLQRNQNGKYGLRCYIAQKDPRPLEWVAERFGGKINYFANNGKICHWYRFGADAVLFLVAVEPFLIVKRAQVQLAVRSWPDKMTEEVALELSRMKKELI